MANHVKTSAYLEKVGPPLKNMLQALRDGKLILLKVDDLDYLLLFSSDITL